MAWYAFFYNEVSKNKYEMACGDRSVVRLDNRRSFAKMLEFGGDEGHKRGYDAFALHEGTLLENVRKTQIICCNII